MQNYVKTTVLSDPDYGRVFFSASIVCDFKIQSYLCYFPLLITVFHCVSLPVLVESPVVRAKNRLLNWVFPNFFISRVPLGLLGIVSCEVEEGRKGGKGIRRENARGEIFSASVSHLLVTVQAERRVKTGRLLQEDFLIEIARSTGEILLLASHAYGSCLSTFSVDYSTYTSLHCGKNQDV